jgi:hypothetical protein
LKEKYCIVCQELSIQHFCLDIFLRRGRSLLCGRGDVKGYWRGEATGFLSEKNGRNGLQGKGAKYGCRDFTRRDRRQPKLEARFQMPLNADRVKNDFKTNLQRRAQRDI